MSFLGRARAALRAAVEARWERWLARRVPAAREILLVQGNVYIMPSAAGFAFFALLLAMLLAGINYENNLVFAFTFLLGGMFVVAVLHTYANLAGLRLSVLPVRPVFAGERAVFSVHLRDEGRRCHDNIELWWRQGEPAEARLVAGGENLSALHLPAPRRGWLRPGRLRVRSYYPLGLLRAWSWVDFDVACLVYPRPAALGALPLDSGRSDQGLATRDPGAEEFSGFRRYAPGDPLRHVAWRTLAKGQPLQIREYLSFADRSIWLDWEQTLWAGGTEERLSLLCRWVLELHQTDTEYGLVLLDTRIEPAVGDVQRDRALAALAVFGLPAGGNSS